MIKEDMEKAKYIAEKERTLFNDLDKAHKKLSEIAHWYLVESFYKVTEKDRENQLLYLEKVNNIYHELKHLLISTKNLELYNNLKTLVTDEKCDLIELKEKSVENMIHRLPENDENNYYKYCGGNDPPES